MTMFAGHAVHVVIVDDARHAALCDCGWVSEATDDVEDSSDAMADHLMAAVTAAIFPDAGL